MRVHDGRFIRRSIGTVNILLIMAADLYFLTHFQSGYWTDLLVGWLAASAIIVNVWWMVRK